ncbi:MAG: tol-pal system YbgF family protein, partial [Acidiferrobacterales bacterium]
MMVKRYLLLAVCLVFTGCLTAVRDDTVGTIEDRDVTVQQETLKKGGRGKAIESYREFLNKEEDDPLRAEAMRRLADLELERSEAQYLEQVKRLEKEGEDEERLTPADYRKAIETYRELLRTHPNYPGNDRVLYQLARAYEQSGDYKRAVRTLDYLVGKYPNTKVIDEAQFRRAEILFVTESFRRAERAYSAVIKFGDTSPFYERALYKHGWSLFKQSRYKPALDSFLRVLDRKYAKVGSAGTVSDTPSISRGEKELMDDTYRVVSLSFAYLGGEKSITKYFKKRGPRPYESIVYQNLGDLYLNQERYQDAANAFNEFIKQYGDDRRTPLFQLKVIEAYSKGGFPTPLLRAKEQMVVRYGVGTKFWASHGKDTHAVITPHLKSNIEDLARHFHAQAQRTKRIPDYDQAARWYGEFVKAFPDDGRTPKINFLLAETLFDAGRYDAAAQQYERTAYNYSPHAGGAEAGYAALLAHKKHEERLRGKKRIEYQRRTISSALRFADAFPRDKRTAAVLTKAAEDLFALNQPEQAAGAARRVVAMKPRPEPALRRTAWTVIAHAEFEKQAFGEAETAYKAVLRLTPADDPRRSALTEKLASSVYKQGEQMRAAGDLRGAVSHFLRVKEVAPTSSITPTAEYDAAADLIALKDWRRAVAVLERFRKHFPNHPLQQDVPEKLAAAYLEGKQWTRAAAAFEEIASRGVDPRVSQEALWQAAELYEKGRQPSSAVTVYQRYVKRFPGYFERSMEARYKLAQLYAAGGQSRDYYYWLRQVVEAADANAKRRTDHTQYLAANVSFLLAERAYQQFSSVRLVIPLAKNLKVKKQKMQTALKEYGRAVNYGVAEFTTAATFRIAEVYHSLSRDLLASERPKGLSAQELEQYDVLLEEQAYPFEEKAIEIHEVNAKRVSEDVYDKWVKKSFEELSKLRPIQYAKVEKGEVISNAIQ